jgi:enterochelin esterase-like enzyme
VNLTLHETLVEKKIAHDYISRPGRHNWAFWCNSIDFQMLFFSKGFAEAAAKAEKK